MHLAPALESMLFRSFPGLGTHRLGSHWVSVQAEQCELTKDAAPALWPAEPELRCSVSFVNLASFLPVPYVRALQRPAS